MELFRAKSGNVLEVHALVGLQPRDFRAIRKGQHMSDQIGLRDSLHTSAIGIREVPH